MNNTKNNINSTFPKTQKNSIITDGLTAGCWSGSFNINLKLNK